MEQQKKTVAQKIHSRKMTPPPALIYRVLGGIWKMLFMKKYGVEVEFKTDFRKEKGPYILVSNHASRADYIFTGVPLLPNTYNYVAGYNEFHRSHLSLVFKLLRVIPKKNFTPDIYTIKEVSRVLKAGGRVVIFPEGMSSISGANQPVAIGTGKFIKHFNLPVYYAVIKGGYLTCPKYNLKDRYGKVKVTFDKMFTPEELIELSPEQIEDRMNELLYHDDYKWNKQEKIAYKNDGNIADDLQDLLYWCPKCGKEFTIADIKNFATTEDSKCDKVHSSCIYDCTVAVNYEQACTIVKTVYQEEFPSEIIKEYDEEDEKERIWYKYHTTDGDLGIRFKNRVIELKFFGNFKPFNPELLFKDEDITKKRLEDSKIIHAWGFKYAIKYLNIIAEL